VEFEYDENGNMTADLNNDIKSISYNALNLPLKIVFNNKSYIVYSYTATGEKIRVDYYKPFSTSGRPSILPTHGVLSSNDSLLVTSGSLITPSGPITLINHTYTEYCGNHILENGKLKQSLFDGGYITYSDDEPELHFYVRDHQGNNRLVMSEDGVVEQVNDYTPFGVQMKNSFTATSSQRYKYNSKELDRMFGLDLYDYGARFYDARIARWQTIDPLCEKYYSISPYVYCANNPIRFIDPDGESTWVKDIGNGYYTILGGNLSDKNRNIYVGYFNEKGEFITKKSIGITTSTTSFFNSDKNEWSKNSIINMNDKSGNNFITNIIHNRPPLFSDYIKNARTNHKYDFKVTNGTDNPINEIDIYRGMPIGKTANGQDIITSARDIGNIMAGYVAASNGMSWKESRIAFDFYQGNIEGLSTRNAEYYGWIIGTNNNTTAKQIENLINSVCQYILSLFK
jgi:RHS repeat-associated protein